MASLKSKSFHLEMEATIGMVAVVLAGMLAFSAAAEKTASTFYAQDTAARVRANTAEGAWGAPMYTLIVDTAKPWLEMDDEALWGAMFGPAITRSWMVWSNGFCPACKESVPMYNWKMDPLREPWKVRCPHCNEAFPKNDFQAYYASGLDAAGVFAPEKADRALLFNAEHADPADPLHGFGVDDGEGYVEGENRWRFIGAYLVYGQWKRVAMAGIQALSAAYLVTGNPDYAHKAYVLLDRVADLYPSFDFKTQGILYESVRSDGYVTVWHDCCEEARELALAYDMVYPGVENDSELIAFLSAKAAAHGLENPKASPADIRRNIEDRILRDTLDHAYKIHSNYPRDDIARAVILAVLGWPENRDAFFEVVDPMLEKATAVDGITGEKGLSGYSSFTIQTLAMFLSACTARFPEFLREAVAKHPHLMETYRFHIDTHCLEKYYPLSGDCGSVAAQVTNYVGMSFTPLASQPGLYSSWTNLPASCFTLLYRLYELSGDPCYLRTAWNVNGGKADGFPHDLYIEPADAEAMRARLESVVAEKGATPDLGSVNKQEWHLAILRSGTGANARALWLDYDSGGGHGHSDGMNLGFFARGLDVMPEFGYPPVQYGGWTSPRARWYTMTAAHNTVVVDGKNTAPGNAETTLWLDAPGVHAIRAGGGAMVPVKRYERTALLVDISEEACYAVDVFRVTGGHDHLNFMQSHFGTVRTEGLTLAAAPDFDASMILRNVQADPAPAPGWRVDWSIEDRYGYLPEGTSVGLRYLDFTENASAGLAEAWVVGGGFNTNAETWLPRVWVRRTAPEDGPELDTTTFVAIIEPFGAASAIAKASRAKGTGSAVALEVVFTDGRRDVVVTRDPETAPGELVADFGTIALRTDADTGVVRCDAAGAPVYAVFSGGAGAQYGDTSMSPAQPGAQWEWRGN